MTDSTRPGVGPRPSGQWEQWIRQNAHLIGADDYGDELLFARQVLPRVPDLSPGEVTPQKKVVVGGAHRRIDFAVERHGLRVAIEIDGWDKSGTGTGQTRAEQQAFTDRQNALVSAGWNPIRYTVSHLRRDPGAVARDLTGRLRAVSDRQSIPVRSAAADSHLRQTDRYRPSIGAALPQAPLSPSGTHRPTASPHRSGWLLMAGVVAAVGVLGIGALAAAGMANGNSGHGTPRSVSCTSYGVVRGNVSETGERIYHLPGDRYYGATNPEQCFATASDAEAAGYRHAKV